MRDRFGRFWKPACGVIKCLGRNCYAYSIYYEKCRGQLGPKLSEVPAAKALFAEVPAR